MSNALKVARIHLVTAPITLAIPWSILGASFAINLLIFGLLGDVPANARHTGGLASIYVFAIVANLQAVTQVFPFVAGLSLTRRAFLAGTALFVLGQSLLSGVAMTVLLAVEQATDGWGISLKFFGIPFLVQANPAAQVLVYGAPFLLAAALGLALGAVFKRWGQLGMLTVSLAGILGFGGLAALATWRGWWGAVGSFFSDTSMLLLGGGYPLLLSVALGLVTFGILRRATP